jgi:hypothetical protein
MGAASQRDVFDRARSWAAAIMLAAAAAAIVGSMLDWVTISAPSGLRRDLGFGRDVFDEQRISEPFTGLEARDGWWTLGAGAVLAIAAVLLLITKQGRYAWLGFLAAMVIGAVAFADYRSIGEISSSLSHRMDIRGEATPAIGIVLVSGAALAGLLGSVTGITASPHRRAGN